MNPYRGVVVVFAVVFVCLGVGMLAVTAERGGGIGYLFGVLFIGLGFGRIYLLRSRR